MWMLPVVQFESVRRWGSPFGPGETVACIQNTTKRKKKQLKPPSTCSDYSLSISGPTGVYKGRQKSDDDDEILCLSAAEFWISSSRVCNAPNDVWDDNIAHFDLGLRENESRYAR